MSVGFLRDVEAVPVDDGLFGQLVLEADAHALATAHADGRAEVRVGQGLQRVGRSSHDPSGEAPHARGGAPEKRHFVRRSGDEELDIPIARLPSSGPGVGEAQPAGGRCERRKTNQAKSVAAVHQISIVRRVRQVRRVRPVRQSFRAIRPFMRIQPTRPVGVRMNSYGVPT